MTIVSWPRRAVALLLCLICFTESALAFDRQDIRKEGMYLSERHSLDSVTTEDPLASLNESDIMRYFANHPQMKSHRVVIGIPSLLKGRLKIENIKAALREIGVPDDFEIHRWPEKGNKLESFLDFFARRQDWQKPIKSEIKTGHYTVFLGEAFSVGLMAYLVLMKKLSPTLGALNVALDWSQQAVFAYPIRFWSNYQRRQTAARQFLFNLIVSGVMSSNFFLLFNAGHLHAAMPDYLPSVVPSAVISAVWGFVGVVAFRWEGSKNNTFSEGARRTFRSNALLLQQILLSPFYIYSISPFASTLYSLQMYGHKVLDLNVGHIAVLAAGVGSALVLPWVDDIAAWLSKKITEPSWVGSCVRFLSQGDTHEVGDNSAEN